MMMPYDGFMPHSSCFPDGKTPDLVESIGKDEVAATGNSPVATPLCSPKARAGFSPRNPRTATVPAA